MLNRLVTGGAKGADAFFAERAFRAGHEVYHYSFDKHVVRGPGNIIEVSQTKLDAANIELNACNRILKRNIHGMSAFSKNLLLRSMIKVRDNKVDKLFAVGSFKETGEVNGGTAWAVTLFEIMNKGTIYFFNQNDCKWYWKDLLGRFVPLNSEIELKATGTYLGIGTRELIDVGKRAITSLY